MGIRLGQKPDYDISFKFCGRGSLAKLGNRKMKGWGDWEYTSLGIAFGYDVSGLTYNFSELVADCQKLYRVYGRFGLLAGNF